MSHTICMWHGHPLHMCRHLCTYVRTNHQMYSWHPTSLYINICNAHVHTHTHIYMLRIKVWCEYDSAPTLPLILAQWGCTVLLRAAKSGCVPLVRALLEDYGSLVDEMNEVSCSTNVRCYLVTVSEVCLVACSVQL